MPVKRALLAVVLTIALALGAFLARDGLSPRNAPDHVGAVPTQAVPKAETDDKGGTREPPEGALDFEDTTFRDALAVSWRARPESALSPNEYRSLPYLELRALAVSGDTRAAAWLAALLAQCGGFAPPQTNAEIDAAIAEMYGTRLVPQYSDGIATLQDLNDRLDSLDANIEVFEKRARTCSSVPLEDRREWEDWTVRALAHGQMDDLTYTLLSDTMVEDDYWRLLEDLWHSGEPTALLAMSSANLLEYERGVNPGGQIRQLAYQLAAHQLIQSYQEGVDASLAQFEAIITREIQDLRNRMPSTQIREAELLATQILEENEDCCLAWPSHYLGN